MRTSPDGTSTPDPAAPREPQPAGQTEASARPVQLLAYSPRQAAAALGVCRATIYNLLSRNEIRYARVGRAVRIPLAEIERLSATADVAS